MKLAGAALFVMAAIPNTQELERMAARFAPVDVRVDVSKLSAGDRRALVPLIEAARVIDDIFLTQSWSGNAKTLAALRKDRSTLGRARLKYFLMNKGPWSALDEHEAFLPGVPRRKLPGANFYPEDMTKPEFEEWAKKLPAAERERAQGFFTVIHRRNERLTAGPYNEAYRADLEKAAALLRQAANATDDASLKRYLDTRAAAFLSNDYYESDVIWMDLDAPLDITIGPYETYNDELFGYKAAFEAYITVRDDAETRKVQFFSEHLQEIENNLPIEAKYRNPKLGAMAPIRVVNEILAAGDAAHGVRTAAFNLPNDERVVREKGSKRVMLKNIQEAKFRAVLEPIAKRVLTAEAQKDLSFDWFFTHILAHELTHGIGPHDIEAADGKSSPRQELKEIYSAIEEAKADVTGLFMLQYMLDRKMLPEAGPDAERKLYTTFLASAFRSLRFGINEAHGRGMALQFNYLADLGAIIAAEDGTFRLDLKKVKEGVRSLAGDLLTVEATGDYAGAKKMLDTYAALRPTLRKALDRLEGIPTDIAPVAATANELAPQPGTRQ